MRLLRRDYEILEAKNGEQALALYNNHRQDGLELIITDNDMPEIGGIQLIKTIRGYSDNIPIIGWSGIDYNGPEMLKAGADVFFDKPVDFRELRKTIDNYVIPVETIILPVGLGENYDGRKD